MQKFVIPLLTTIFLLPAFSAQAVEKSAMNEEQKIAYAMGSNLGTQMAQNLNQYVDAGMPVELEVLFTGFMDAVKGNSLMDREESTAMIRTFQTNFQLKKEQNRKSSLASAGKEGLDFLKQNSSNPGVVTLASGLQYLVLSEGNGSKPAATDKVKVHYAGTLINGNEFDSSYKRGTPAEFPLNGVISGWTEGLQLMTTGSKYRFFIPPDLAYGSRAVSTIPANSTLIFEVELLDILGK
ncbi:MAG: FKBP-type peptidyl-prolyl cis-trans isomerase [Gammaproteobacteria bacterium]|nr:FKBP-type peptidyl-prolyl cis-trans isomerase [Gammaproteobacteria bacterium]